MYAENDGGFVLADCRFILLLSAFALSVSVFDHMI
jgi:hypothetical protein